MDDVSRDSSLVQNDQETDSNHADQEMIRKERDLLSRLNEIDWNERHFMSTIKTIEMDFLCVVNSTNHEHEKSDLEDSTLLRIQRISYLHQRALQALRQVYEVYMTKTNDQEQTISILEAKLQTQHIKSLQDQERIKHLQMQLNPGHSKETRSRSFSRKQSQGDIVLGISEEKDYYASLYKQEVQMRVELEARLAQIQDSIATRKCNIQIKHKQQAHMIIRKTIWRYILRQRWKKAVGEYSKHPEAKRIRHRNHIVREILSSEKQYVNYLEVLVKRCIPEVSKLPNIKADHISDIFMNAEQIYHGNKLLFDSLQQNYGLWPYHPLRVGECFLSMVPTLDQYSMYVNNFNRSMDTIQKLGESNKLFLHALQKLENDPACMKQTLGAILIMPIQRIPRYLLLLGDLLKHVDDGFTGYQQLLDAYNSLKILAESINERKRECEMIERILDIQSRFVDNLQIYTTGRKLIHEGSLTLLERFPQEVHMFVFNDLVVIASAADKGFRLLGSIPVRELLPFSIPINMPFTTLNRESMFEVAWETVSIFSSRVLFLCPSRETKALWFSKLQQAIQDYMRERPDVISHPPLDRIIPITSEPAGYKLDFLKTISSFEEKTVSELQKRSPSPLGIVTQKSGSGPSLATIYPAYFHPPSVKLCGYIYKRGTINSSNWKKRWFAVDNTTLYYYKQTPTVDIRPSNIIPIKDIRLAPSNDHSDKFFSFDVHAKDFVLHLACDSWLEMKAWAMYLQEGAVSISEPPRRRSVSTPGNLSGSRGSGFGLFRKWRVSNTATSQSIQECDESNEPNTPIQSSISQSLDIPTSQDDGQATGDSKPAVSPIIPTLDDVSRENEASKPEEMNVHADRDLTLLSDGQCVISRDEIQQTPSNLNTLARMSLEDNELEEHRSEESAVDLVSLDLEDAPWDFLVHSNKDE